MALGIRFGAWTRRLAVGLALSALVLAAAEGLARVLFPLPLINDHQPADGVLGFRNPVTRGGCQDERGKFQIRTNSMGCRGPELPPTGSPRDPSKRRVLLLGDSFLQPWRVREEDWVGGSLRAAMEAAGTPVEVFSLGADDYGTAQELLALRTYGERVQPDEVVLEVFPANDLVNNTLELAGRCSVSANDYFRPYLVPAPDGSLELTHAQPWRAFLRHSTLYRVLEQRWLAGRTFASVCEELSGEPVLALEGRVRAGRLPEEHLEIFRTQAPGSRWETAWERTQALVLATRAEAERLGARFTVVVIPELRQVERTVHWVSMMLLMKENGWANAEAALDLDLPERRLEEWFERERIPHVILLGPLRRRVRELRTVLYLLNGHFGAEGQRLMGQQIAQRLAGEGKDMCFESAGGPVDVPAFLGDAPFVLDLTQEEHRELFSWGWTDWESRTVLPSAPGRGLATAGAFLAHAGFMTLEGVFTNTKSGARSFTLDVQVQNRTLARQTFDSTQPFRLSFVVRPEDDEAKWVPATLQIEGQPWVGSAQAKASLLLQTLRFEPEPPPHWNASVRKPPPHLQAWLTLRFTRFLLRLPAQFLGYATQRFVTRRP